MKRVLRLSEYTSLDDVASWIAEGESDQVVLSVSGQSSFAPTVEGVALGALQQLAQRSGVAAECTVDPERISKLFESVFGVALILTSRQVLGPDGEDVKLQTAERLWGKVVQSRGQIGTGNRSGIVFRDPDYSIPHCLRSAEPHFPKRDQFRASMGKAVQRMGYKGSFSESEGDVITFLYEAAQNAHDHARVGADARAVRGVRGILFDRITVTSSGELATRKDFPEFQRAYIRHIAAGQRWPAVLFAFTVADLGPGIQHTLPALPGETAWDRLNRAFLAGVTRKHSGPAIEAGRGLSQLYESAARIRAMIFVRSAELSGYIDFSSSGPTTLQSLGTTFGSVGTSLTLMWPTTNFGGDQGSLFGQVL